MANFPKVTGPIRRIERSDAQRRVIDETVELAKKLPVIHGTVSWDAGLTPYLSAVLPKAGEAARYVTITVLVQNEFQMGQQSFDLKAESLGSATVTHADTAAAPTGSLFYVEYEFRSQSIAYWSAQPNKALRIEAVVDGALPGVAWIASQNGLTYEAGRISLAKDPSA